MGTKEELLDHLWREVINRYLREDALDNVIAHCKRFPNTAFSETGPAIERILAAGASRRDLQLVLRSACYESVFGTLYAICDPGEDNDDVFGLYEELLMADPSGMDGRSPVG
jgi:hypothetical protein